MKKLLIIIFTTTLLFAQAGNDRSAEFFSNWYDTILGLEDTTVTGASNQWIQDGRGNRTGISISDDGKTGFGTLEPDKLIGLSDGTDQFSISVYNDKFTIWNDAGVPLALFTIDSVGNVVFTGSVTTISMPSFSVYQIDAGQTGIAQQTNVLIVWGVEEWDSHNDFTANTFTPSVAGKYILTTSLMFGTGSPMNAGEWAVIAIYKNGVVHKQYFADFEDTDHFLSFSVTAIVEANGSTDYFDVKIHHVFGGPAVTITSAEGLVSSLTYFQGHGIP